MKYITPIYDRTADDVTNKTAKAFFNVADWQRVYNNQQVTKALLDFLLSINIPFNTLTAPSMTTIPTVAELNALLENIEQIRADSNLPAITGLTAIKTDWAEGSSADSPDYLDVNDWERVLHIIFGSIAASVEYAVYCGVANTGQPRFYQHRFRQFAGWVQPSVTPTRKARAGISSSGAGLTRNNGFRRYD
jgi:hypothetical protein